MAHEIRFVTGNHRTIDISRLTYGERGLAPMIGADQIANIQVQVSGPRVTVAPAATANESTASSPAKK